MKGGKMDKNEKTVLKTSKSELAKRYTVLQILLNMFNGNNNLDSKLFLMKKQNNIQAKSKKEFDILKLFSISKKEKKWFLFCVSVINFGYIFLWETFADEYQIINNNNSISFFHLFFAVSLVILVVSSLLFVYECDF